ncbi:D-alanyl-D-alanine carboxypeptidase family protein [Guptibacillus hwajinpoensis]|uniref:D-alanyl-D-alanine carboxypeptidase family protein n=1 Tax=Guptibacillus hwajinpoensis TaxID=208199 RepID=UPI001CFEB68C|nr:D-alanyl-D-alanine carboxypeptidase family protein [Pseudalkalibacillus hwajinpoensis]WLR60232.1 D-alanyl-D-alanine carboxypeptidase family protein [Pseudalkalibacillus hwajinpoensis]
MILKQYSYLIMVICLTVSLFPSVTQAQEPPNVRSETAILIDGKTGQILFNKNGDDEMYPASITKIVTAFMAVKSGEMDDMVTVSERARQADGTRVYLKEGEIVSLEKLVKGMMVNSGNDAAIAIAEHLSGSVESFSEDMNEFLRQEIGVKNTNFVNPNGLFNENHVTTAEDMARITQYAMKNEQFRSVIGIKKLEWVGEDWETTLINHHRLLLDYDFVTGGKNGYVSESGFTLVTTATKDGQELIAVTMKANDDQIAYQDTLSMLNYGFNAFTPVEFKKGTELGFGNNEEYSLSEDMTLYQVGDDELDLTISDNNILESKGDSYVSILDADFLEVNSLEEDKDATIVESETKPAAKVKDEETASLLSSENIFYFGIGVFVVILLSLFFGRSHSSQKRHRTFP